jgi:hypothetical protein
VAVTEVEQQGCEKIQWVFIDFCQGCQQGNRRQISAGVSYQSDTMPATMTLFVCTAVRQHCSCSFGFLQDQRQIGIRWDKNLYAKSDMSLKK